MLFRWIYWHILLSRKELPVEPLMSMAGNAESINKICGGKVKNANVEEKMNE